MVKRAVNLLKIFAGYLVSRMLGKPVHWGNPVAASIEPNNTCNLRCPECPAGMQELTRRRGHMQPDLFNTIIGQLSPHLSYLTLYFQGEPYLNPHFFEFVATARAKRIFVATSTNGHFLDAASVTKTIASGLNRLIISLDGSGQEQYQAYRTGGDFAKVVAGIKLLVQEKRRLRSAVPEIILQCLVLKSNEHHLAEIRRLGKEMGVDRITFKTAQFNDFENGNPLMPENQRYSRYKQAPRVNPGSATPRYVVKNRLPNACFRMWSSCVFTWEGDVVPCCFDKDASRALGNIKRETFHDIWRGKGYDGFRRKILESRKTIDICANCSQTF
ncbi:MAG: radical SAM/SPASM domain-containing protein [Bacteroidota bacterium]